jgi:hypothetical protein
VASIEKPFQLAIPLCQEKRIDPSDVVVVCAPLIENLSNLLVNVLLSHTPTKNSQTVHRQQSMELSSPVPSVKQFQSANPPRKIEKEREKTPLAQIDDTLSTRDEVSPLFNRQSLEGRRQTTREKSANRRERKRVKTTVKYN